MKYILISFFIILVLVSCSSEPSESSIQTAIALTQIAESESEVLPNSQIPQPTQTDSPRPLSTIPSTTMELPTIVNTSTISPVDLEDSDPELYIFPIEKMPTGYIFDSINSGYYSNAMVATTRGNPEEFISKLENWGRINGYAANYQKTDNSSKIGYSVVIMATPEGARDYHEFTQNEQSQLGWSPISMPTIADASYAQLFTSTDPNNNQIQLFNV